MDFLAVLERKLQDKCEIRDGPFMMNIIHNPDRYNQTVLKNCLLNALHVLCKGENTDLQKRERFA